MIGRSLLVASALLIAAALALVAVLVTSVPETPEAPETLVASGLGAPVSIRFDDRARPFVRSESLADAFYALGWLHVRDRRWQLELLRRAGQGRLAELLGPSAYETDAALRTAGVPGLGRALAERARPDTLALVDAWLAGAELARQQFSRPPEFVLLAAEPTRLTRADVFAVGAIMAFDSANNLDNELLRLALADALDAERAALFLGDEARPGDAAYVFDPEESDATLAPGPPAQDPPGLGSLDTARRFVAALRAPLRTPIVTGSSAWAVAPTRSAGGAALFAFDSHDGWSMPSLLYEAHLFWRDEEGRPRQLRGFTVPGLPGVINGFTERIAWGLTNIGDSQDLFVERWADEAKTRVLGPEGPEAVERRSETVPVRFSDPRTLVVERTRHGPLVSRDPPLSLAWSGQRLDEGGIDALLDLNRARSWEEADRALDALAAPSANATYADVAGRIVTRVHGTLPVRGAGLGRYPQAGDRAGVGWRGWIASADLPRRVDPPTGWVAAANARSLPPDASVLVSADNAPGYRARRLRSLLDGDARFSTEDFRRMQLDVHDTQAERLLRAQHELLADSEFDDELAEDFFRELEAFARDPEARGDSAGMLAYAYWYQALITELFEAELGEDLTRRLARASYPLSHAVDELLLAPWTPDAHWSHWGARWAPELGVLRGSRDFDEARRALLRSTVRRAAAALGADHGADPVRWRWDAAHQVYFPHALASVLAPLASWLDRGPWPWGGGNATLGRARYRHDRPFQARGGASMRLVVELSDPPRAWTIMPGGQSGHPSSPHYDDQFPAFLAGELDELPQRWPDGPAVLRLVPTP